MKTLILTLMLAASPALAKQKPVFTPPAEKCEALSWPFARDQSPGDFQKLFLLTPRGLLEKYFLGELTAEDVKYSLERMLKSDWSARFPTMDHVDVKDKYSGTIVLKSPFAGTWLMRFVAPARLLLAYALACAVLAAAAMLTQGVTSIAAVIGIAFFMSIMFPTIFSLGIHGVGPHTEMGSSLIIMAIVGGALLPPLFGLISDVTHNVQLGYAVPLLCFLYIAWFARVALQDSRAADKAALLNGTSEACLN